MTALKRFARLECPGLWQPHPEAQRVEAVVSFGASSLVMTDLAGRPLAHWSLAAVARINPSGEPALYTPSAEATELLEVADDTMIEAIETVRRAIARARPRSGRVRTLALAASLASVIAGGIWWLPGALVAHAVAVLPEPTRAEIGADLFASLGRVSAGPCHTPRGDRALASLVARIGSNGPAPAATDDGEDPGPVVSRAGPITWGDDAELAGYVVVPDGIAGVRHLPGGIVLVGRALVEDHEQPEVLAGYLIEARIRAEADPPLREILTDAGLWATAQVLTTGHLPKEALARHTEALTVREIAPAEDERLLAAFAEADIPSTPYAYARDVTGETVLSLIEGDPMRGRETAQLLLAGDWSALQAICGPR